MSWFDDTFLPSLFERFGRETHWLTRKQTAICTRYMERHTVMVDQFQGPDTTPLLHQRMERPHSYPELFKVERLRNNFFWIDRAGAGRPC